MCKLGERSLQHREESWGHDQSQSIHRHVMMNAMQQEVQSHEDRHVRQVIIDVEQEAMQGIFEEGPDDIPCNEAQQALEDRVHGHIQQGSHRKVRASCECR